MDTNIEKITIDDSDTTAYSLGPQNMNPEPYVEEPEYNEYRQRWELWDSKTKKFREVPPPAGKA